MSINRKTKSAEAQIPQAPSEEDFVGLIKYISEREKTLHRYSDKLRGSLQRIFDVFGDHDYCQICDVSEGSLKHVGQQYASETSHIFVPKIRVSEDVFDNEVCIETTRESGDVERYRLAFRRGKLLLQGTVADEQDEIGECSWYTIPNGTTHGGTPSRAELKQLVRSGRLPKFLQFVATKLREAEVEYAEVSEIAEKMANITR